MAKKLYGTDPDQVPTNADLGTMAYQDSENVVMVDPLFQHDDSRQAKFKRVNGAWSTIEILAGSTTGNSRIAFTDPDTEDQVAQNTADGMIDYEHSADALRFYTDQTLAAQFTSSGNLLFPNGQGIDFSATAGPTYGSATSELLDDYEEGTWTPIYQNSGADPSLTYSEQTGYYTKIGDTVHLWFRVIAGTVTTQGTGALLVGGFPYIVKNSTSNYSSINVAYSNSWTTAPEGGHTEPNRYYAYLKSPDANGNLVNNLGNIVSGDDLIAQITYKTA